MVADLPAVHGGKVSFFNHSRPTKARQEPPRRNAELRFSFPVILHFPFSYLVFPIPPPVQRRPTSNPHVVFAGQGCTPRRAVISGHELPSLLIYRTDPFVFPPYKSSRVDCGAGTVADLPAVHGLQRPPRGKLKPASRSSSTTDAPAPRRKRQYE
jgi:hypothetical protein